LLLQPFQKSTVFVQSRILHQAGSELQAFQEIVQNYVTKVPTKIKIIRIFSGSEGILWLNNALCQLYIEVVVASYMD
jgi:hypothetical protein